MAFDPDSPTYRTCCCHVRTCTIVIGVLNAIGLIAQLIRFCIGNTTSTVTYGGATITTTETTASVGWPLAVSIVSFIIGVIVVILLFVGVSKQHHAFLIPHLVFQIIGIIGAVVLIIVMAIGAAGLGALSNQSQSSDEANVASAVMIACIIVIVVLIICIGLEIWFFIVVLKCYRFFRDQRAAGVVGPGANMGAVDYKS